MKFAGRLPLGTRYSRVLSKQGPWQHHENGSRVLACGLACSEIFSGLNLAKVLEPSHAYEKKVLESLRKGEPASTMSLHTSAGVNPAMDTFMEALESHLPPSFIEKDDHCVSLQVTGADAVWAGVDLLLQLQQVRGSTRRRRVAVAEWSYHGPGTSAFGRAAPLGPGSKTPLQCTYPAPQMFARYESDLTTELFEERSYQEFVSFLNSPASDEVGVMLVEPQWGSSCVAQPWDPQLLRKYVEAAQAKGILILSDEIMCGLGRHGQQGTTFCIEAWKINADAVTFGKAVAAGVEPLAGAVLKCGARELGVAGKSVLQMHTYAGASTRALLTGASVLDELVVGGWRERAQEMGTKIVAPMFEEIQDVSHGVLSVQGQGLMWGGVFLHPDMDERRRAIQLFRKECESVEIVPYFVGESGGFMFTPTMDVLEEDVREAGARLATAVQSTSVLLRERHGWKGGSAEEEMLPHQDPYARLSIKRKKKESPAAAAAAATATTATTAAAAPAVARYKGPTNAMMTESQRQIFEEISQNRTTGVRGPFGPWLANPEFANYAQHLGRTCRYDLNTLTLRRSEMVILMTAQATDAPTEWDIHVVEARRAGLEEKIIEALAIHGANMPADVQNEVFAAEVNGDDGEGASSSSSSSFDRAVYNFASDLNRMNRVSDLHYWNLHEHSGDVGCVELVGLVGYYGLVSLTLNTFEIQP